MSTVKGVLFWLFLMKKHKKKKVSKNRLTKGVVYAKICKSP